MSPAWAGESTCPAGSLGPGDLVCGLLPFGEFAATPLYRILSAVVVVAADVILSWEDGTSTSTMTVSTDRPVLARRRADVPIPKEAS